jgi:hypothetical protein
MSKPLKYTREQIELVKSMLGAGQSVRDISKQTGIPKSTVHWIGRQQYDPRPA